MEYFFNLDVFNNELDTLRSILDFGCSMFGPNKSSFLLTFGCVVTSLHYKQIIKRHELGIPVLVGPQSVGKTSCAAVLIAAAGRQKNHYIK